MRYVAVERFVPIGFDLLGPKTGFPLVICHGLGAYHIQWEVEAHSFSKTRPVLRIDLRGHGASAEVRNGKRKDYSITRMAEDVVGVIEHCGFEKVDFLGNSLGGMIGLEIIHRRPDILRSLITCGTAYRYRLSPLVVWVKFAMYYLLGKYLPGFIANQATTNVAKRPLIREMYANASRKVMHLIDQNIYTFDRQTSAKAFPGPIVVLRGSEDNHVNRHLDPTIEALLGKPNFHVINLPDTGHFTNLDKPEEFENSLRHALEYVDRSFE
ncbi:MAG: alpha/beta hydrolase [Pseudomonadota bacterium]